MNSWCPSCLTDTTRSSAAWFIDSLRAPSASHWENSCGSPWAQNNSRSWTDLRIIFSWYAAVQA